MFFLTGIVTPCNSDQSHAVRFESANFLCLSYLSSWITCLANSMQI